MEASVVDGRSVQAPSAAADLRPVFLHPGREPRPTLEPWSVVDATPDRVGIATVLTLGYALGTRTAIEQASVDRVDPVGFARDREPAIDELTELCVESVRRTLGGERPIVLLSGGRDSRLILLCVRALGVRPRLILTIEQSGPRSDAAVAARLAASLGESVEVVPQLAFSGARELRRHALQGFQSLEHEWFLPIAERVRAERGLVTDGIGAGVLSTGSLMQPEAVALWNAGDIEALFDWTAAHGGGVSSRFLARAAAEGLPVGTREQVLAEFATVLDSLRGCPNPLGMYSLLHWTRRGIAANAFGLLPSERVAAPLYERELCRSLAAIPMERAAAWDWREAVISELGGPSVPYATDESRRVPRWLSSPLRSVRSRFARRMFRASLGQPLANLADAAESGSAFRRPFERSAVGLLASLERALGGFASDR